MCAHVDARGSKSRTNDAGEKRAHMRATANGPTPLASRKFANSWVRIANGHGGSPVHRPPIATANPWTRKTRFVL